MCLSIYTSRSQIPKGIKYIRINDEFFDGYTNLQKNDMTEIILKKIDKAEYHSPSTFIGRDRRLGALNKTFLSTGTKTLLNILAYPEICFDVCECGDNALELLIKFNKGNILWSMPVLSYAGDGTCNLCLNGVNYHNFFDLMKNFLEEEL